MSLIIGPCGGCSCCKGPQNAPKHELTALGKYSQLLRASVTKCDDIVSQCPRQRQQLESRWAGIQSIRPKTHLDVAGNGINLITKQNHQAWSNVVIPSFNDGLIRAFVSKRLPLWPRHSDPWRPCEKSVKHPPMVCKKNYEWKRRGMYVKKKGVVTAISLA